MSVPLVSTKTVAHKVIDGPWYRQVTREQWRAFWAVFLGWVVDSFDFNILTFILIDIKNDFTVDRALAGALGTVTLIMRLVGGSIAGTAADKWGRKLPLMLSVLWFSLFAFLSGFSTSYAMLFGLRALFGLGMGGEWAAGMPLVFEHWPTRLRGLVSGMMLGGWYWGYLLAAATFQFIYPMMSHTPGLGWRAMFWTAIVPALFTFWIRAKVTESPVWLEQQRRLRLERERGAPPPARISLIRLFQRDLIGMTVQTTIVIGAFMCIYYSVVFWYPTFLREAGRQTLPYLAAFNAGAIGGTFTWGRLSETARPARRRHDHHHPRHCIAAVLPLCRADGNGPARRLHDGLLRHGRLGHGAGVHGRAIPHRGARRRSGLLLSRRRGDRRADAVAAREVSGQGRRSGHRDDGEHGRLGHVRARRHLERAGNEGQTVHHWITMNDDSKIDWLIVPSGNLQIDT